MPVHTVSLVADSFIFPEREYGIVGGGANETVAMQQAITDASAQGRIIMLPPFEITVSQLIIPAGGVRIWGQSGGTSAPLSSIKSTSNQPIFLLNNFQRDVELKNFKIVGSKTAGSNQHGIQITGAELHNFRFEKLVITQCGSNGIHFIAGTYSYVLQDIISSDNAGHGFWIDAQGSPCVTLLNCYAGTVAQNNYGFWIERGNALLINCNSLDGGTSPVSCVRVGNAAVGVALATLKCCNLEAFSGFGIYADTGSDVVVEQCTFVAPGAGVVQPIYLVQPTGRSFIDASTKFISGGATYDNAAGLAIKIFSRWINAPFLVDPVGANHIDQFYNSDDGRAEPFMNLGFRAGTQSFAANYTEHGSMPGYYGCTNTAAPRTLTLLDPASTEVPDGRIVVIKDESGGAGANNITVQTVNIRNIDGAASVTINTNYGRITLVKRGNNYWRID